MLLYSDQLLLIEALAKQLGVLLADKNKTIVTAESCTGGWVAQAITQVAGSSGWFDRGFITYSDRSKKEQLGVRLRTITKHGAVSREVVEEMVAGAAQKAKADFALAVSGVAGPGGGSDEKPVGTVWFAWSINGEVDSSLCVLPGDRRDVRAAAVTLALQGLVVRVRRLLASELSTLDETSTTMDVLAEGLGEQVELVDSAGVELEGEGSATAAAEEPLSDKSEELEFDVVSEVDLSDAGSSGETAAQASDNPQEEIVFVEVEENAAEAEDEAKPKAKPKARKSRRRRSRSRKKKPDNASSDNPSADNKPAGKEDFPAALEESR